MRQLLPTQLTVGMIEVREKARHLTSLKPKDLQEALRDHPLSGRIELLEGDSVARETVARVHGLVLHYRSSSSRAGGNRCGYQQRVFLAAG